MSPIIRRILNFSSSLIHASLDILIHQAILSLTLSIFSEHTTFEAGVALSGIIAASFAFESLYGISMLVRDFAAEKKALVRAGSLSTLLTVLFALTSRVNVPFIPSISALCIFMAAEFFMRYSIHRLFDMKPAYALENLPEKPDKSLRRECRYDMKAVLRKKSIAYFFMKRAFDMASSGFALLILSPILIATAIAIKLDDGGPILYSAERWGKDLKIFRMHKFRSMKVNAESMLKDLLKDSEMTGHAFKIKNDPRITRVGKFIRKYSIDELPQLWNIFTGDMSVVGPRPIMTVNTDEIDDYDKQRWLVRPGLTCYWQVSGRADVKWAQWIEMDLDYIENMSMTEDIKLIFKTFPVVFKADGAY